MDTFSCRLQFPFGLSTFSLLDVIASDWHWFGCTIWIQTPAFARQRNPCLLVQEPNCLWQWLRYWPHQKEGGRQFLISRMPPPEFWNFHRRHFHFRSIGNGILREEKRVEQDFVRYSRFCVSIFSAMNFIILEVHLSCILQVLVSVMHLIIVERHLLLWVVLVLA